MNHWEYDQAIRPLKQYIRSENLDPYQKLLAQINLASAWIAVGDQEKADRLLSRLRPQTLNYRLLHGNSLELSAQAALFSGDYKAAESYLKSGEAHLYASGNVTGLFVRKWRAFLGLHRKGYQKQVAAQIEEVRQEAIRLRHFETVRDCDYYRAVFENNAALFTHIFYGTPYLSYRRRMMKAMRRQISLPDFYCWDPRGSLSGGEAQFDLTDGRGLLNPEIQISSQELLGRLLQVLSSDFYRPASLGQVFNAVYPEEYFNPWSSPARVARLIQRFRQWVDEHKIPWGIRYQQMQVSLEGSAPYALRLTLDRRCDNKTERHLRILRETFAEKSFTTLEVAQRLNLSRRSAARLIERAMQDKIIEKLGRGRAISYREIVA